jgi:hypothetical protein
LVERVERLEVSCDGAFEKLLGLRLGSEAADGFEGKWLSRRRACVGRERCGLHQVAANPSRLRMASNLESGEGRNHRENRHRGGESAEKDADSAGTGCLGGRAR